MKRSMMVCKGAQSFHIHTYTIDAIDRKDIHRHMFDVAVRELVWSVGFGNGLLGIVRDDLHTTFLSSRRERYEIKRA